MILIWSDYAKKDLQRIYDFYADKNEKVAIKICQNIISESKILESFPEIGKIETDLSDLEYTFRSLLISTGIYKVMYFIDVDTVYIAQVFDCRQNPESIRRF